MLSAPHLRSRVSAKLPEGHSVRGHAILTLPKFKDAHTELYPSSRTFTLNFSSDGNTVRKSLVSLVLCLQGLFPKETPRSWAGPPSVCPPPLGDWPHRWVPQTPDRSRAPSCSQPPSTGHTSPSLCTQKWKDLIGCH